MDDLSRHPVRAVGGRRKQMIASRQTSVSTLLRPQNGEAMTRSAFTIGITLRRYVVPDTTLVENSLINCSPLTEIWCNVIKQQILDRAHGTYLRVNYSVKQLKNERRILFTVKT